MVQETLEIENMPGLVIVTGMSGAGRTEAMHVFEDLGYFCVDNLPSNLIPNLVELNGLGGGEGEHRKLAVVCDARNGDYFGSLGEELSELKKSSASSTRCSFDADDDKPRIALQVEPTPPSHVHRRHDDRSGHRA